MNWRGRLEGLDTGRFREDGVLTVVVDVDEYRVDVFGRVLESLEGVAVGEKGTIDVVFNVDFITSMVFGYGRHQAVREKIKAFQWTYGVTHVKYRRVCAGGDQSIYRWDWSAMGDRDQVLFLQAGIEVSPHLFLWLQEAHLKYGADPSVAGFSFVTRNGQPARNLTDYAPLTASFDEFESFQAFSLKKEAWHAFRKFYGVARSDRRFQSFEPYVQNIAGEPQTWIESSPVCKLFYSEPDPIVVGLYHKSRVFAPFFCGGKRSITGLSPTTSPCSESISSLRTWFARFTYEYGLVVVHPDAAKTHTLVRDVEQQPTGIELLNNIATPVFSSTGAIAGNQWGFYLPDHPFQSSRRYRKCSRMKKILPSFTPSLFLSVHKRTFVDPHTYTLKFQCFTV